MDTDGIDISSIRLKTVIERLEIGLYKHCSWKSEFIM